MHIYIRIITLQLYVTDVVYVQAVPLS